MVAPDEVFDSVGCIEAKEERALKKNWIDICTYLNPQIECKIQTVQIFGTIHLRRRHLLGGRGQKLAKFADR